MAGLPKRRFAIALLLLAAAIAPAAAAEWPGGAKVAVNVTFDVDGETLWWDDRETMQGRRGPLSQGVYGPTVALPKILALLERHDIRATFFVPAWIAETWPDEIREIADGGHEIGAHGVVAGPDNSLQLQPANAIQDGPARIVTLSSDPTHRNFTLGQERDAFDVRLRTQKTSANGMPSP